MSTSHVDPPRPVPHLDAARLEQVWETLSVGSTVAIGERRYLVYGFDPAGADRRRVYLEELGSRIRHELVVDPA